VPPPQLRTGLKGPLANALDLRQPVLEGRA
jgi:hypothetical protein